MAPPSIVISPAVGMTPSSVESVSGIALVRTVGGGVAIRMMVSRLMTAARRTPVVTMTVVARRVVVCACESRRLVLTSDVPRAVSARRSMTCDTAVIIGAREAVVSTLTRMGVGAGGW